MTYHFQITEEKDGFWAKCIELSGCSTQADSIEELKTACHEALNLYLEEPGDSNIVFPLPDDTLDGNEKLLKIQVEPEIALAILLRHYRTNAQMTQKQVATLLGMKNIYSYQRLERKSNPTLEIIKRLKSVFPDIRLEYIFE